MPAGRTQRNRPARWKREPRSSVQAPIRPIPYCVAHCRSEAPVVSPRHPPRTPALITAPRTIFLGANPAAHHPPCPVSWVPQGTESAGSRFCSQGRALPTSHLQGPHTHRQLASEPCASSCAMRQRSQHKPPACGVGDAPQEPAEEEDDRVCSRVTRAGKKMWRGEDRRGMSWCEMRPRVSEGPRRSGHQQSPRGKLGEAEPCRCRTQGPQPHSQAHGHPAGGPRLTR